MLQPLASQVARTDLSHCKHRVALAQDTRLVPSTFNQGGFPRSGQTTTRCSSTSAKHSSQCMKRRFLGNGLHHSHGQVLAQLADAQLTKRRAGWAGCGCRAPGSGHLHPKPSSLLAPQGTTTWGAGLGGLRVRPAARPSPPRCLPGWRPPPSTTARGWAAAALGDGPEPGRTSSPSPASGGGRGGQVAVFVQQALLADGPFWARLTRAGAAVLSAAAW